MWTGTIRCGGIGCGATLPLNSTRCPYCGWRPRCLYCKYLKPNSSFPHIDGCTLKENSDGYRCSRYDYDFERYGNP